MRNIPVKTVRIGLALAVVALAASVSAQVAPSTKLLIGTWKYSAQKSKLVNTQAPKDVTRTYEDRGDGTYSYTQVTHTADGTRSETRYVAKEDGTENDMFRMGPNNAPVPSGATISFTWTDTYTAEQTQTAPDFVATATRKISQDGKTMTLTVAAPVDVFSGQTGADPMPDIMVFDK